MQVRVRPCEICGEYAARMCVDHCHKTGRIRGILCHRCNSGLGLFRDDPELLGKAIQYLRGDNIPDSVPQLQETEKEQIARALTACKGNQRRAARMLGIDPKTLYNKRKKWGISVFASQTDGSVDKLSTNS